MAIKINAGAAPKYGRITMPRGTFLSNQQPFSNPSTAASGSLGAGSGQNPSQIIDGGGGSAPTNPLAGMGGLVAPYRAPESIQTGPATGIGPPPEQTQFYNAGGVPVRGYKQTDIWNGKEETYYNPVVFDRQGNRYTYDVNQQKYVRDSTGVLNSNPGSNFSDKNASANPLVGGQVADPNQVTTQQIQAMIPGMSVDEINTYMLARGYTRNYTPGVGETWTKSTEAAPSSQLASSTNQAISAETDARGRPNFVDPTLLTPGQRVTASSGVTYYGGTPTKEGKSQYAVVLPGVNDKHGRYKTVSYVKQDAEGNWVRVTYQKLRSVYTKHGRQNLRNRAQNKPRQQQEDVSALVTLRANYG